jgi:hypothetical protein
VLDLIKKWNQLFRYNGYDLLLKVIRESPELDKPHSGVNLGHIINEELEQIKPIPLILLGPDPRHNEQPLLRRLHHKKPLHTIAKKQLNRAQNILLQLPLPLLTFPHKYVILRFIPRRDNRLNR